MNQPIKIINIPQKNKKIIFVDQCNRQPNVTYLLIFFIAYNTK